MIVLLIFLLACSGLGISAFAMTMTKCKKEGFDSGIQMPCGNKNKCGTDLVCANMGNCGWKVTVKKVQNGVVIENP